MNDDHQHSLYSLFKFGATSSSTSHDANDALDVLLNAIEANPNAMHQHHDISHDTLPSLSAFFSPEQHHHHHHNSPHPLSEKADRSISSLLAASQQLAAPSTTPTEQASVIWNGGGGSLSFFGDPGARDLMVYDFTGDNLDSIREQDRSFLTGIGNEVGVEGGRGGLHTSGGNRNQGAEMEVMTVQQPSGGLEEDRRFMRRGKKRKWDAVTVEDKQSSIRSSIKSGALGTSTSGTVSLNGITTILCIHPSVTQKSYAGEKRYLSPPPLVRISGPLLNLHPSDQPKLMMTLLISDSPDAPLTETCSFGPQTIFRSLHAGGEGKMTSFMLNLSLHDPLGVDVQIDSNLDVNVDPDLLIFGNDSSIPLTSTSSTKITKKKPRQILRRNSLLPSPLYEPFATFSSSPITLIAKPSKKTARTRTTISCIFEGTSICLYNRINSQTARTKYMAIDQSFLEGGEGEERLCARSNEWSAFTITILKRSDDFSAGGSWNKKAKEKAKDDDPRTVTYGSDVILTDLITGVSSDRMIVRKVEKNKVLLDAVGPVSQLQKVAFCRIVKSSRGGGLQVQEDGEKTIYLSTETDGGLDLNGDDFVQEDGAKFVPPPSKRKKKDREEDVNDIVEERLVLSYLPATVSGVEEDELEDHSTWTVIGIDSFTYSYFDASSDKSITLPTHCITPFPKLVGPAQYQSKTHTISFTVSNFFYQLPGMEDAQPLEVWLGPHGPLVYKLSYYEDEGPITGGFQATGTQVKYTGRLSIERSTILVVKIPSFEEMALPSSSDTSNSFSRNPPESVSADDFNLYQYEPTPQPEQKASVSFPTSSSNGAISTSSFSLPLLFVRVEDGVGYLSGIRILGEKIGCDGDEGKWRIKVV